MPKISGLGVGEVKKISGAGLGQIKKVSGLGLGLMWQDMVQQGMYKNGDFATSTTQETVTGWIAEDSNSTVSGNSLLISSAGSYFLQLRAVVDNTNFLGRWVQFFILGGPSTISGTQQNLTASQTGYVYTLSSASPVILSSGALISVQSDAQNTGPTVKSGVSTWLRAVPAA